MEAELARVIAEKNYFVQIALHRDDVITTDAPSTIPEHFQLMRPRRQPWSIRRKQAELKYKVDKKANGKTKLTEGEKLFEEALKEKENG